MYAHNSPSNKEPESPYPINKNSELLSSSEETFDETTTIQYQVSVTDMQAEASDISESVVTVTPWELIQEGDKTQKLLRPLAQKMTALSFRDDQVRVVIHNITQLTEEDVQQRSSVVVGESGMLYDEDINEKL